MALALRWEAYRSEPDNAFDWAIGMSLLGAGFTLYLSPRLRHPYWKRLLTHRHPRDDARWTVAGLAFATGMGWARILRLAPSSGKCHVTLWRFPKEG